jgi:type II secretion system protein N
VRLVVLPLTFLTLVVVFIFLGFPYDVLADRAIGLVERQTGAVIRYGEVEPRLAPAPGFRFHRVDVRMPDGARYQADPVSIRPAWSFGWLLGEPQLRAYMLSDHGSLAGFVTLGSAWGWDGRIVDLDLAALPLRETGVTLTGRADIEADVRYADGVAEGEIDLEARQGDIVHEMTPMPVEFDTIEGRVELGGEHLARIDTFTLDGPLFGASVTGTVGQAADPAQAPLDLSIGIEVREPGMRSMVRQFGMQLDRDGKAGIDVGGTVSKPRPR